MLGRIGPVEIIIFLVIVLLIFGGRGKISGIMGDFAKGIKSFRKGSGSNGLFFFSSKYAINSFSDFILANIWK